MPLLYNSPVLWNTNLYSYNGIALIVGETRTALTGIIRDLSILTVNVKDLSALTTTVDDFDSPTGTVSDHASISGTLSDYSAIIVSL
jgi:hypothetical protein